MTDKYFLDSNVILYALGNDLRKKQQAQRLINREAVISTQVLTEVVNVCLKKFALSHEIVGNWFALLNAELEVKQVSSDIIFQAIQHSKTTRYGFYDSLIIATALNAGTNILYSEDMQSGHKIEHLKIVNPFL